MPTPYAYLRGEIMPLAEAKIGVMTHAFNYGTGVFEGIRGNWNADRKQIFLFKVREHYERLFRSAHTLRINIEEPIDQLCDLTVDLVRRSGYQEDIYVRPL